MPLCRGNQEYLVSLLRINESFMNKMMLDIENKRPFLLENLKKIRIFLMKFEDTKSPESYINPVYNNIFTWPGYSKIILTCRYKPGFKLQLILSENQGNLKLRAFKLEKKYSFSGIYILKFPKTS